MARILSVEGRRLLELARASQAKLGDSPLAASWRAVVEALARGWLTADGPDSLTALIAELDSGGGLRVEDLAIEVSFDDPRGETVLVSLGAEQVLASRSGLVRELRGLLRAVRGDAAGARPVEARDLGADAPAPAPGQEASAAVSVVPSVEIDEAARAAPSVSLDEAASATPAADAPSLDEPAALDETVGAARVELRQALNKVGALLKERLQAAAGKTESDLAATTAGTRDQVDGAAAKVRASVDSLVAALRKAVAGGAPDAAGAAAGGPPALEAVAAGEVDPAAPSVPSVPPGEAAEVSSDPGTPGAGAATPGPFELISELKHRFGAGAGEGESRSRLAEAVRRIGSGGGGAEPGARGKLAEVAGKFADWVQSAEGGGAAVESLLHSLGNALTAARQAQEGGAAAPQEDAEPAAAPAHAESAEPGARRHLRLVKDEPEPGN